MSSTITGSLLFEVDNAALSGGAAGGAEVSAYDAMRKLVYILGPGGVDALDAATGALRFSLPAGGAGIVNTIGGTSVAVKGDLLAVSYEGAQNGTQGSVAFYRLDAAGTGATLVTTVAAGATPDQIVFTADGSRLLVAVEGQPNTNYADNDPAGTLGDAPGGITVIDTATMTPRFIGFEGFDAETLRAAGVRIKAGATAAQDLEPEYITLSPDGTKAYVTLQENNAIAVLDMATLAFEDVFALGSKDHSLAGNGLDASNQDGGVNIATAPVRGLYMPDGVASFDMGGKTYLVTANEGDAREYDAYTDITRVASARLDEAAFGGAAAVAALKANSNLGRLTISAVDGDTDGDGDLDVLYSLGGRSMSIWEVGADGLTQTWDSGDLMERILAADFPALLNDGRSDDKGPEPESVTLGRVNGQLYAFVALERSASVMSFRIDGPGTVSYAGLVATGAAEPEVISFIAAEDAPAGIGGPLLIAPNEGDGVTTGLLLSFPLLGTEAADVLRGTLAGNSILAGGGDDLIFASRGQDTVAGGAGFDTLRFEGATLGGGSLARDAGGTAVSFTWADAGGSNSTAFSGIERLQLVDATVSFSGASAAAQVSGLYHALLGREADAQGLSFWTDRLEEGADLAQVAAGFAGSAEGQAALAGLSGDAVVGRLYSALLGRAGETGEIGFWRGQMEGGASLGVVAASIAASGEAAADPLGVAARGIVAVDAEMILIARGYEALLGRAPDLAGLAGFNARMEQGLSEAGLVRELAGSQEYGVLTGGLDSAGFVARLYEDVLGRAGDAAGLALHQARLDAGAARGDVAYDFLASAEGQSAYARFASDGIGLI